MIVEFVGLPGAGKSTIAALLSERLQLAGYACANSPTFANVGRAATPGRRGRLQRAAHDFVLALAPTWRCRSLLIRMVRRSEPRRWARRYWRLMRTWLAIGRLRNNARTAGDRTVWVLDQGLLQCLFSILPPASPPEDQYELTRGAIHEMRRVLPDLVVVVAVDEETAAQRLRSRPFQQTSYDLDHPDLPAQLTPRRSFSEEALPRALAHAGTRVLRVDGSVRPPENVAQILGAVVHGFVDVGA
jgi:thymidylate kinase